MKDKANSIALTDLVRALDHKEPGKVSNWISGIIKEKEDFSKRFQVEHNEYGRPEKILVYKNASIFVDNLCILKPYMSFFEKSNTKTFSPYQALKDGSYQNKLAIKSQKVHNRLNFEKENSENALEQLSIFVKVLEKNKSIDITSESLRDLMRQVTDSGEVIDLSNSFQIAAWNELAELKEKLREEGENSILYRSIGEKMIELGEIDGTIEALNEATRLDQNDGIAWAIKAKIYLDLFRSKNQEHMQAMARTEFNGPIAYPINSEEHAINQIIEDTFSSTEDLHSKFIEACFWAFKNWPHWKETPITDKQGIKHRNFMPSTKITYNCSSDISRDWLFFHFVIALRKTDLNEEREKQFIKILRSFQHYDPEMHPLPYLSLPLFSAEYEHEAPFKIKLIQILSWFSPEDTDIALKDMISRFKSSEYSASENIAILSRSPISALFWKYLGRNEYIKLYSLCEEYERKNREKDRIEVFCRMQLKSILSVFSEELIDMMKTIENYPFMFEIKYPNRNKASIEKEIKNNMNKAIIQAQQHLTGWQDFIEIDKELWKSDLFESSPPHSLLTILFIAPLLEIAYGKLSEISINTLISFVDKRSWLKIALASLSFELLTRIFNLIYKKPLEEEVIKKIKQLDELTFELYGEIMCENIVHDDFNF